MANNWKQIYNSSFVCAQLAASLSFTGNQSHGKQNKQKKHCKQLEMVLCTLNINVSTIFMCSAVI